jgi:hypothetical protein
MKASGGRDLDPTITFAGLLDMAAIFVPPSGDISLWVVSLAAYEFRDGEPVEEQEP